MLSRTLKLKMALVALIAAQAPVRAETKKLDAIPGPMIGLWAWSAKECTSANADGRVVVGPRTVLFNASGFELQDIRLKPDGALHAGAIVNEEGETSTSREAIELRLVAADRLSVKTGASGELAVYIRCPAIKR